MHGYKHKLQTLFHLLGQIFTIVAKLEMYVKSAPISLANVTTVKLGTVLCLFSLEYFDCK